MTSTTVLCIGQNTSNVQDAMLLNSVNIIIDKSVDWSSWDSLSSTTLEGVDVILVFDFSSECCIDKLAEFKGSIYFINCNHSNKLTQFDIGDFFAVNNTIDYDLFKDRYPIYHTLHIPDINLCLVPTVLETSKTTVDTIGVCLPYSWINQGADFERMADNIVSTLVQLAKNYNLVYIPFETQDLVFSSELERRTDSIKDKITIIDYVPTFEQINTLFSKCDYIIGSHYTSIILSICHIKPFLCMYTENTPLAKLKYQSTVPNWFVRIDQDIHLKPIKINQTQILNTIKNTITELNYINSVNTLTNMKNILVSQLDLFKTTLNHIIDFPIKRLQPPSLLTETIYQEQLHSTIHRVLSKVFHRINIYDIDKVIKGLPLRNIIPRSDQNNSTRKIIAEEVLWEITGDPYGIYYYGLYEKIFSDNFINQLEWIIKDYYLKYKYSVTLDSRVTIINKNFQDLHRSGWELIVNEMIKNIKNIDYNLIIDTYVDKTFHWNKSFYTSKNIIPYTKPWIGFIHHTFSTYSNTFNCQELLQKKSFTDSLQFCKCLIVLNKCLQHELDSELMKLGYNIKVFSLTHPTDLQVIPFTWSSFIFNKKRAVVQVGNWLRNVYSIYKLLLPKTSIITRKCVLQNKNSENYFIPENFFETFVDSYMPDSTNASNIYDMCRITSQNNHIKGMYSSLVENQISVETLQHLPNHQYDLLLSENIVFLHLVDASAVNTIIECMVRNTPIIVNKIDPVVQYLGEDYPLYYTDFYEASKLLDDSEKIKQAHLYLKALDKTEFDVNTFITKLGVVLANALA